MVYNADDPKQVKNAKDKAALDDAMKLGEIKNVMQSYPGRAWIYSMLARCSIYEEPFVMGYPDGTAFNNGKANIGRQLLAEVQQAAPDLYLTMIQEAKAVGR